MPVILLPQDSRNRVFQGVIETPTASYTFSLWIPEDNSMTNMGLSVSWEFDQVLKKAGIDVKEVVAGCVTVEDVVSKLESHIVGFEKKQPGSRETSVWKSDDYLTLMSEIRKVGWEKCVNFGTDMRSVVLQANDTAGRTHLITLQLNDSYPMSPPNITTDLPEDFSILWQPNSDFKFIYTEFEESLYQFQQFWNIMDDLDANAWVLEPEYPKRKDNFRRIVLKNNISLSIRVDHRHPTYFPVITPIGPDSAIKQLESELLTLELEWEEELSVVANLEKAFGFKLPRPVAQDVDTWEIECCICLSFRLEGEAPSVMCDDERCNRQYHACCLYDWLQGLPTSRLMRNKIYGECLNCTSPISMNIISRQETL